MRRNQLHIRDNVIAELRAFDFRGAFHLAGKVVGDAFAGDRAVETFDDQVGRFRPAEVTQHHFAGENNRARIDHVFVGVLRCGAVGRFENGVTRDVVDVATGGDADTAIAIRTAVIQDGRLYVQAGAGIVYDSDPEKEWDETMNKGRALFRAVAQAAGGL